MEAKIEKILQKSLKIKIERKYKERGDWTDECLQVRLLLNGKVISSDEVVINSSYYNDDLEDYDQMD